jgi:hypothetical protein
VLLLDGEELAGAKQNRVLNTTILLPEKSETVVPVSCTEANRWSYLSALFEESGEVMSAQIRAAKVHSVSRRLQHEESSDFRPYLPHQIRDLRQFIARLAEASDPFTVYLRERFSEQTRAWISEATGSNEVARALPITLTQELNNILLGPSIWDEARLAKVAVRPDARSLAARNPQGRELVRLHRWLFEDAFPGAFRSAHQYASDQGGVWNEISELHHAAGSSSPTGAMKDAYKARQKDLEESLRSFALVPGQTGLLAVVLGKVAGFDIIPHPEIYTRLHSKLVKSYAIDALRSRASRSADIELATQSAKEFLQGARDCTETAFPSIGHGTDYRYENAGFAGTALVHNGDVVHTAFFAHDRKEEEPAMASLRRRQWMRS